MKRRLKLLFAGRLEGYVQRLLLRNPEVRLVAVGGSVGKTSTKLATAAVLKQRFRVSHHEGNYNDPISVPLSIMNLPVPPLYSPLAWLRTFRAAAKVSRQPYPAEIILVELGTDQPGDLPHFMKYLHPDVGVVTSTTPEHMEMFGTEAAVIREELALAEGSVVAIVNSDDAGIKRKLPKLKHQLTFGTSGAVHFAGHEVTRSGTITGHLCLGQETIAVKTNVIAEHSLYAILAAAAVGRELGLTPAQIAKGIGDFHPVAGRMNPLPGINGSLIIDDSYNASPDAVIAALQALQTLAKGRAIAVLGNMNELGDYARTGHERAGAACGDLDLLVTIGRNARDLLAPAAAKAGLKDDQIKSFMSPYEAGDYLKFQLRTGDTVLVKGSQNGVFSEEATALLLRDPADRSKLVRQTPEWRATKREQFGDHNA